MERAGCPVLVAMAASRRQLILIDRAERKATSGLLYGPKAPRAQKGHRHLHSASQSQAVQDSGLSIAATCLVQGCQFRLDLLIDLGLVIETVGHRGTGLHQRQMRRMLAAHLVGRPAVCQLVHHNLRYMDPRQALQSCGLIAQLLNVRIGDPGGHLDLQLPRADGLNHV